MRTLTDPQGHVWQAALLEASYGNVALLFSPLRGSDIRCQEMPADTMAEAEAQFASMADEALLALLEGARPWSPG
ncbi:hypothetical protein CDEF62S_04194 [Castellaniella defragrans]